MRRILNQADYDAIVGHLAAYQKGGETRNWEEYRKKIPDALLKKFAEVQIECRRNGFINPKAIDGNLIFAQIRTYGEMTEDLCTLCDRECRIRSAMERGEYKPHVLKMRKLKEPKKCWQK